MKIGIVLKDRCHDDVLKCDFDDKNYSLNQVLSFEKFLVTDKYIVAIDEIKYIYKISD